MEAVMEQPTTETGTLCVLDATGDTRVQWNRRDPAQVQAAKARFDELRGEGYLAYKVDKKGTQGEVMAAFDPDAERVILHARMIGG